MSVDSEIVSPLQPGDAAAFMASLVSPFLKRKLGVRVSRFAYETAAVGVKPEVFACPELSEAIIQAAICDLAPGGIPKGKVFTRNVLIDGESARVLLSPYAGFSGGPGPRICYVRLARTATPSAQTHC